MNAVANSYEEPGPFCMVINGGLILRSNVSPQQFEGYKEFLGNLLSFEYSPTIIGGLATMLAQGTHRSLPPKEGLVVAVEGHGVVFTNPRELLDYAGGRTTMTAMKDLILSLTARRDS